jgi:hypothetical protein
MTAAAWEASHRPGWPSGPARHGPRAGAPGTMTARPWPGGGSSSPRRGPRPAPTCVPARPGPAATRHDRMAQSRLLSRTSDSVTSRAGRRRVADCGSAAVLVALVAEDLGGTGRCCRMHQVQASRCSQETTSRDAISATRVRYEPSSSGVSIALPVPDRPFRKKAVSSRKSPGGPGVRHSARERML